LVAHPRVAEAAVVSRPHDVKGESVFAFVVLNIERPEGAAGAALIEELRGWVAAELSPIAKPDEIRLSDNLPKTRSGKIMRRLLRAIARGEDITQDVSTLENPAILDQLRATPMPTTSTGDGGVKVAMKPVKAVKKTQAKVKGTVKGKLKAKSGKKLAARAKVAKKAKKAGTLARKGKIPGAKKKSRPRGKK
jgi:hypothetical protein